MKTLEEPPVEPSKMKSHSDPKPRPFFKKASTLILLAVAAMLGLLFCVPILLQAFTHESTDDAFVDGRIIGIAPKVSGKITRVEIADNQDVKQGELLFEIDPRDELAILDQRKASLEVAIAQQKNAESAIEQAQAHVGTIQAGYASAVATLESARADAKRQKGDLQRNQKLVNTGAISAQEYDHSTTSETSANATMESRAKQVEAAAAFLREAQTQVAAATASAQASTAGVALAKAQLAQAELQLSYTRVTAPEAGRVTSKSVEPGAYVQTGQSLFALVPHEVWVTANFKETQIALMHPGQAATVRIDAFPGHLFRAHVDSLQAGSGSRFSLMPPENATGNFVKVVQRVPVKIVFDEPMRPGQWPGPGMSAVPSVQVRGMPEWSVVYGIIGATVAILAFIIFLLTKTNNTNAVRN